MNHGLDIGLSFQAVQTFARKLFISLHHTRSLGLIHADLKPDNILIKQVPGNDIYVWICYSLLVNSCPILVLRFPKMILTLC